ncbi:uncharacterized protein LOC121972832 [Zingiber officinale]|uniref:uncharacterized protein LOC121972832 n=1 Tax=Zingiber officinale TaxID=94328 RepID=UPI001C4D6D69|nr:uncharacterized protein LOC121972832 [Zingiber officinale]
MFFYLTTLGLARILTEETPKVVKGVDEVNTLFLIDKWNDSEFLCRNYILNNLADSLYLVYCEMKTVNELWKSLDKKYKSEDAGAKKFIVGRFLEYKMSDSKSVISQVQELQATVKANVVDHGQNSKRKHPKSFTAQPKGQNMKKKFLGKCYNCDRMDHKASDCKRPKKKKPEANLAGEQDMDLCAMISEVNLIGSNPRQWWINTGATRHVCCSKELLHNFEEVTGDKLFMGNSTTLDIMGQRKVVLKMTSDKDLTLNNVLRDASRAVNADAAQITLELMQIIPSRQSMRPPR